MLERGLRGSIYRPLALLPSGDVSHIATDERYAMTNTSIDNASEVKSRRDVFQKASPSRDDRRAISSG